MRRPRANREHDQRHGGAETESHRSHSMWAEPIVIAVVRAATREIVCNGERDCPASPFVVERREFMNAYFATAGSLAFILGLLHSVMGEWLLFRRLSRDGLPPLAP